MLQRVESIICPPAKPPNITHTSIHRSYAHAGKRNKMEITLDRKQVMSLFYVSEISGITQDPNSTNDFYFLLICCFSRSIQCHLQVI